MIIPLCLLSWGVFMFVFFGIPAMQTDITSYTDWAKIAKNFIPIHFAAFLFTAFCAYEYSGIWGNKWIWLLASVLYIPVFIVTYSCAYIPMEMEFSDRLYFSIVTFTTLGYGDFHPTKDLRILAATQGLIGFLVGPIIIAQMIDCARRD